MPNVEMPNGDIVAFPDDMPGSEIRALIEKKFPNAKREADARTGRDPYQNMGEAVATAVGNLPASVAESKYRLGEMLADYGRDLVQPSKQIGNTPPLIVRPGAPIEEMLQGDAAPTAFGDIMLPDAIAKPLAEASAKLSVDQQLRRMQASKDLQPLDVAPGSAEEMVASGVASAIEMAPPAVASVLIRNPAPLVAYFTARSAGTGYGEAKEAGAGSDTARTAAGLYAAAEAVTEAIAGKVFVEGGKTLVGSILKGVGVEGITEAATEAFQALVDAGVIGKEMTLDEAVNRIKTAGGAGAIAGGVISPITHLARGEVTREATPQIQVVEEPLEPEPEKKKTPLDLPIEERADLPAPGTLLALPPPEAFPPPEIPRRQPPAPEGAKDFTGLSPGMETQQQEDGSLQVRYGKDGPWRSATMQGDGTIVSPEAEEDRRVAETRSTVAEVGRVFTKDADPDQLSPLARQVYEAIPPKLRAAGFRQAGLSRGIEESRELLPDELVEEIVEGRTTDPEYPAFVKKLNEEAAKVIAAPPVPEFTEENYGKAIDAVRNQGRYTAKAIKEATGLKDDEVRRIRDAMVRRGQLVQRGPSDYRLYDVLGEERQPTPGDLPPGAFREHVIRRVPVNKVRIRQDGKSIGTFGAASEARGKVSELRAAEVAAGKKPTQIAIEPAEETAWGVMENRYDEAGNLLGQAVVDSYRDEADAQRAADQLNAPAEPPAPPSAVSPGGAPREAARPVRKAPTPEALAGRLDEILKRLNKQAGDRQLPLLNVRVKLRSDVKTPDGRNIEGDYFRQVIRLATSHFTSDMTTDEIVEHLAQIMDHELIHALRMSDVLGPETQGWKTLVRYTKRAKRPGSSQTYFEWAELNYRGEPGYTDPTSRQEEAIAEAFRYWAANRRNVVGQPATVFRQIVEWFRRLINAVPDDLFTAIETGQLVEQAFKPPGSNMPRAKATAAMETAAAGVNEAQQAQDENLVRVRSREYLRARAQAREDRFGRSGPKTVLGTTPSRSYEAAPIMDRGAIAAIADKYRADHGITENRLMTFLPEDVGYLMRVADAQQKGVHDPKAPDVAKAYRALADETLALYKALGPLEVTPWTGNGPPYQSPAEMFGDISAGNLRLRLSADLFGEGADNRGDSMYAPSGLKTTDGQNLVINDLFRVVHDVYGHGQSGFRDDPRGQYNAYHEHARLLSPEARKALATETLAQSAWANYGPHLRRRDGTVPRETDIDYLAPSLKEFAEQKSFLLPDELIAADPGWALAQRAAEATEEYPRYMVGWHGTPHKVDRFSSEKIGTGEGAQAFGWGLYFAGKKEVAEYYRNQLGDLNATLDGKPWTEEMPPEQRYALGSVEAEGSYAGALYALETIRDEYAADAPEKSVLAGRALDWLRSIDSSRVKVARTGNLYKVDIPSDDELMLWDVPLSEQPVKVRRALAAIPQADAIIERYRAVVREMFGERAEMPDGMPKNITGDELYTQMSEQLGGDRAASAALHAAGIPGHRYLDQGSRNPQAVADAKAALAKWEERLKTDNSAYVRDEVDARRAEVAELEKGVSYNYVIYDDSRIEILEENPKFSKFADSLPGGRLYGNPNRSPGGALSKPGTPTPEFTHPRPGNQFFGGDMVAEQLRMVRAGERGTVMIYMSPGDFLTLAGGELNPEQGLYDDAIAAGYKASTLPSFVTDGYAGNVRVTASDGDAVVRALVGRADTIPVVIYPRKEALGLVTALEANGVRVPWPHEGRQENFIYGGAPIVTETDAFKRWFGDSKVVDENGKPMVVYHGTSAAFEAFDAQHVRWPEEDSESFFFTDRRDTAEFYAEDTGVSPDPDPRVIEAYLSLKNPLELENEPGFSAIETWDNSARELRSAARDGGHDGVIISGQEPDETLYIAFEPTQIKSATENRGTFDPKDPRIRYSLNDPFGLRVPNPPPPDARNIVQQRIDNSIGRWIANLGRSKRSPLGLPSIFDLRITMQDKMLSWKEVIEDIKQRGGSINDINDIYMLEQLYHGKVVEEMRERENRLMLPLLTALKAAHDGPRKIQPKDFEDYLYARHAPERNAYLRSRGAADENPSGMSDAEANDILDRFALAGKLPELGALARLADRISTDTTRTRVDAGLISEEAANASPYRYYVPLRGFAEEELDPGSPTTPEVRARSGKGFSIGGREDRTVTGRSRKAGDIIGHLFLQNTEAVIRAQKNEVALSAMRLLQDNPNMGYGQILATAPTRRVVGANGMIHEAGDPTYRQQPDIFTAKWKGKEIIARVADPRLARAIKSDYVTTSNDLVNSLINWAGMFNRYLATINTSLNPEFIISNLARDMQTAGILSQQYDIPKLGRKILGNAPKAMGGIREVLRTGEANSPWAKAFREMQQAGGTTEFLGIHDLETQVAKIRRSVTQTGLAVSARKTMEYLGKVFKFVDDYNKVAENAFRLSAYAAARENGASVKQAAFLAKNLTINFNKGGEQKSLMNAMYLFYNASTQGTFVLLNGLKNKRVQKIVAGVVVGGILMDILNRVLSDDEDKNGVTDYDDIPDYVLETNFVLMDPLGVLEAIGIKQGYFALPMPYGFNAFFNLGRNLSASFSGSPVRNPAKGAMDSLLTFTDAFNPLGGVQSIWNFIAPTFADPFVDLITNKDFAGNDIVPERPEYDGVPVPDSQKYWSTTSEVPKWISEHLNRLTGGNEVRKGAIDVSPETLQYAFDYAFGSAGRFVQRVTQLGTETTPAILRGDFEDIEIGDIPFARRVVGSVGSRGNTERYYSVAREIRTVAKELKLFEESGRIDEARALVRSKPVEVSLIGDFEDAEKELQSLRKELRELRASDGIPAARKRDIETKIKENQDRIMAILNRVYFDTLKRARQ